MSPRVVSQTGLLSISRRAGLSHFASSTVASRASSAAACTRTRQSIPRCPVPACRRSSPRRGRSARMRHEARSPAARPSHPPTWIRVWRVRRLVQRHGLHDSDERGLLGCEALSVVVADILHNTLLFRTATSWRNVSFRWLSNKAMEPSSWARDYSRCPGLSFCPGD